MVRDSEININDFDKLIEPIIGLPVSRPWKGYGVAAFFELGELVSEEYKKGKSYLRGEADISIDWLWRLDSGVKTLFGSADSEPKIAAGLKTLKGQTINGISVDEDTLEINVSISNGHFLRSMNTTAGYPQWWIRLPDGKCLNAECGFLNTSNLSRGTSDAESAMDDIEEMAALRWGIPKEKAAIDACRNCRHFCRMDGSSYLLDYGVCLSGESPFDGRSVRVDSGCIKFKLQA